MKETDHLEPQQYRRLYWEADVPLRDLRARLLRRLLWIATGVFALMCATAYWAKFPDQIELPFVLKNEVQEEVYKFPFSVYLQEQYVQTGAEIKPNDRLLRLSSPEVVAMLGQYRAALQDSANLANAKQNAALRERDMVRNRQAENRSDIASYTRQLELARQTWAAHETELRNKLQDASDKAAAYKTLYENGNTVARFDMTDKENQRKQAENNLQQEKLRYEKESLRLQAAIAQSRLESQRSDSELAKMDADFQASTAETLGNLQIARRRLADLFGPCELAEGAVIIKSRMAGRVSFVFEGEKEISSGATVLKLSSGSQSAFAFLKCPPDKVGKLRVGQPCHLKVSSFPFYEYGSAAGHIRQISLSPDEQGQYNLYLAIDELGRLQGLLQPGMDGTAVLVIEEKTLFQYFFRGLKRQYHRVME